MPASAFSLDPWCAAKIGGGPYDRAAIERHQLMQLRETLAWAVAHSPFYRDRLSGFDPLAMTSLEALRALPFTRPDDVRRNQPSLLCVSQSEISRVVTLETSGTSGTAKRLYFTHDEQEATIDFFRHGMAQMARHGDRVLILFPCERPGSVGRLLADGLTRLGAVPIEAGPIRDMAKALATLRRDRPQVVAGLPVQVRALARCDRLRQDRANSVRRVLVSADRLSPRLRQDIGTDWDCEVFEHYGMTETGLGGAVECHVHQGCHIRENDLLIEIVDPETGAALPAGERGEVTVTTLTRRGMPLIRYRTGDLSRLMPLPCPCGSPLHRIAPVERDDLSRVELAPGIELTLDDLDQVLFAIPDLTDFAVTLRRDRQPCLQLESAHAPNTAFDAQDWSQRVLHALDGLPALGHAREQAGLCIELTIAETPLCLRGAKRTIATVAP
jgi:phenylacetate-CoA ligase